MIFMRSLLVSLVAFVIGCAVQLQQRELFSIWFYMLFGAPAGIYTAWSAIVLIVSRQTNAAQISATNRAVKTLLLALAALGLGFALTGWRALAYQSQAISAQLEGQDIRVTGIVAQMPRRDESGLRFRFDVESAQLIDSAALEATQQTNSQAVPSKTVKLPASIQLAWYRSLPRLSEDAAAVPFAELTAQAQPQAGERWQLVARLKAPHGHLNPHGFDYELWLWEQGLGATGYVRAGLREAARGDAPLRIGSTWQHPIEAARQSVRDAIAQRIADAQLAGVLAALVVGDQASIERADWDVFRATGVAHLMSISGLHITMFAWGAALLIGALWRRSMRLTNAMPAQHAALVGGVLLIRDSSSPGRSGSSFTAQLGAMEVNEEIDALRTIGLDPVEVLVLPRVIGLMITLPLLTVFANLMALLGGCLMAILALDLPAAQILPQLAGSVTTTTLWVGLVKAPVFAFLIAMVGCFEGLRVEGSAESVGRLTTQSVVESIFLVIVFDAFFSILFSFLGV
ncbi:MAG: DUF4131 domain-containing protein [Brachymonas sp.]|nr:DUF4131 domain-containing protein [Brachymonas sp.]